MLKIMKRGLYKKALFLVSAYIVCWLVGYVLINQDINLALAFDYFIQAWGFNGFVRPMYVWWASNVLFIVVAIIYLIIIRRSGRE
jgi:hypothetical protein